MSGNIPFPCYKQNTTHHIAEPPLWLRDNIAAYHLVGLGLRPGQVNFPGWGFFPGFFLNHMTNVRNLRPHPSPDTTGHLKDQIPFIIGANDLRWHAQKPPVYYTCWIQPLLLTVLCFSSGYNLTKLDTSCGVTWRAWFTRSLWNQRKTCWHEFWLWRMLDYQVFVIMCTRTRYMGTLYFWYCITEKLGCV